jgi:WD40 repeat protein
MKKQICLNTMITVMAVMFAVVLTACEINSTPLPTNNPVPEASPTGNIIETPVIPSVTPEVLDPTPTPTEMAVEPTADSTVTPTEAPDPPVISVENLDQLEEVDSFDIESPMILDWSRDGKTLAVSSRERAFLYDIEMRQELEEIVFGEPEVILDVCADTGMVVTTSDQKDLSIYQAGTGLPKYSIETDGILYNASFSPAGNQLAVPSAAEIAVDLYDSATGEFDQRLTGFETAAPVYGAKFSSNGAHIIWISRARVQPMQIDTKALGPDFGHQEFVSSVAMAEDDSLLAVATAGMLEDEYKPVIQLWDANNGDDLGVLLPGDEIPSAVAILPDGGVLVNTLDSQLQFWDLDSGDLIHALEVAGERLVTVAVSPDGRRIATAGMDGRVRIWAIPTP